MTEHKNLTRRGFLAGAALAGIGATSAGMLGCTPSQTSSDKGNAAEGEYMTVEKAKQKWTFEVPPEPIPESDITETVEADVVVVGSGTSGLVTAYSALEQGLSVVVVSASSKPISRGGSNHAAYSKTMESMGIKKESATDIEREMALNYGSVDHAKWYRFYNNSEDAMNWMIDIMENEGFKTGIELSAGIPETSIYYQHTSAHGWYKDADTDVIGMTQPYVVETLAKRIESDGGRIFFKNIGRQLIRDNDGTGRVTAIICERDDGSFAKYAASKAVVLATGDFSANRDMMAKYCPQVADSITDKAYDNVDYDKEFVFGGLYPGDGQRMGLWVGAAWQKTYPNCPMGACSVNAGPTNRPYANFFGLLVNRDGKRFMNEYASSVLGGTTQKLQPGSESFALWDVEFSTYPDWYTGQGGIGLIKPIGPDEVVAMWDESVATGTYVKADTIEDLLDQLGLPPETKATIDRYNELCAMGRDEDFYKSPENLYPLSTPPFYGHKATPETSMPILTVMGGLRTDVNMRVCDENDMPIPGLYNVGTMVGDFYAGTYSFQSMGVNYGACCLTFGYLTGRFIAENE